MKTVMSIIIILFLLGITGCSYSTSNQDKYPTIILERYDMYSLEKYQFQRTTITNSTILFETFNSQMNKTGSSNTSISSSEFNKLVDNFKNFNKLNSLYKSSVNVADIGAGDITFINGSKKHTVTLDPYVSQGNPQEVQSIIENLNQFISRNVEFSS